MSSFSEQIQQHLGVVPPPGPTIPEPPRSYGIVNLQDRAYNWVRWKAVAEQYLPGAVHLRFRTDADSDDEGGTVMYLIDVVGYDAFGAKVEVLEDLRDEFDDAKDVWDLPDDPTAVLDFSVLPSVAFHSRTSVLHELDRLQEWVAALPDACFAPEVQSFLQTSAP